MPNGYQKISVNLSNEVVGALRELAEKHAVTVTEILRRSVSAQNFIEEVQSSGKRIYVVDPATNESERVIFR